MTELKNYIFGYLNEIEKGNIKVSKKVYKVFKKAADEISNPVSPYEFNLTLATKPIIFIETFCKNSKGKWMGKPIELMLWQKAIIQVIYGFVHQDTKKRRARDVFIICGRKNGKSVLTSGLGLYDMTTENGGQVTAVAPTKHQAMIVFDEARNMVLQSEYLSGLIRKRKSDMYMDSTFSSFIPLANKSDNLDGLNSSFSISDEIHEIKDRGIYDIMKQSQTAREQPLMFTISTAGFVREGLFDILYQYGNKVIEGEIEDDSFLPFFYEMENKEAIQDKSRWEEANPSLGVIKSISELEKSVEKAKHDITFEPTLLTKDFNIISTISGSWLTMEELKNDATFDLEMFRGSYCIGGVDLSEVGDLTCATIICMKPKNDIKYVHQMYFMPEQTAELKKKTDYDIARYEQWIEQGYIKLCSGNKINYSDVTAWFEDIIKEHGIIPLKIGIDRWNTAYWKDEMIDKGFELINVGQGFKDASPAMKELQLEFGAKRINYNNNPVLRWCLSNTQVTSDPAGNIKFDKRKNKKLRNDGMTSLYDAYKVLMDNFNEFQSYIENH